MITLTIEAILAVVFVVVLMQLFKKRSPPPANAVPQPDLANLKPADARTGDVISVSGAGDNMSDLDFTAERGTWYQAGSRRWLELSGHYRERRVALRVATVDDETSVAIDAGTRKLSLEDLGLTEDDLAQIDERQNPADNFEFDGKSWLYRVSREAQAAGQGGTGPTGFYYWEFQEQNGPGLLTIRKPEGEPFLVALYSAIPASDVTIYRKV